MPTYTFDEKKHVHMLDGKKIKGCTTVLDIIAKPALIQWAANLAAADAFTTGSVEGLGEAIGQYVKIDTDAARELDKQFPEFKKARLAHRKKKDDAADWGTIVHKAIEVWIKTKAVPTAVIAKGVNYILLPEHVTAVNNFVIWASQNNVEFLESEKGIYSEEWQIGGIVDFVYRRGGRLYVGDVKTSSGIYETYFLQVAAYAKMLIEMNAYEHFDGMVIVNCKKDGTIDVEERNDVAGNIKCFEAAITLHNRLN